MATSGHLLFIWTAAGYRLEEHAGDAPQPGSSVAIADGTLFTVQKLGASPLPSDPRPCAFLIREP